MESAKICLCQWQTPGKVTHKSISDLPTSTMPPAPWKGIEMLSLGSLSTKNGWNFGDSHKREPKFPISKIVVDFLFLNRSFGHKFGRIWTYMGHKRRWNILQSAGSVSVNALNSKYLQADWPTIAKCIHFDWSKGGRAIHQPTQWQWTLQSGIFSCRPSNIYLTRMKSNLGS